VFEYFDCFYNKINVDQLVLVKNFLKDKKYILSESEGDMNIQ